ALPGGGVGPQRLGPGGQRGYRLTALGLLPTGFFQGGVDPGTRLGQGLPLRREDSEVRPGGRGVVARLSPGNLAANFLRNLAVLVAEGRALALELLPGLGQVQEPRPERLLLVPAPPALLGLFPTLAG